MLYLLIYVCNPFIFWSAFPVGAQPFPWLLKHRSHVFGTYGAMYYKGIHTKASTQIFPAKFDLHNTLQSTD